MSNFGEYVLKFYYGHHGLDIFIATLVTIGGLASLALILFDSSDKCQKAKVQKHIKFWTKVFICLALVMGGAFILLDNLGADFHYRNGIKFWKGEDNYAISTDTAVEAFRKAAEMDHPLGCQYLGYILLFKQDNPEGLKMLDKAIKFGSAKAAEMLGRYYEYHCKNLKEETRKGMAYIAYCEAVYLGVKQLQNKVEELKPYVSLEIQGRAIEECKKIFVRRKL